MREGNHKPPLTDEQRKLVADHADVAVGLASRLTTMSASVEDRVQDGFLGLIDAARTWRTNGGASFRTYAAARVFGAVMDAEREGRYATIRVPRSALKRGDADALRALRPVARLDGRKARTKDDEPVSWSLDVGVDHRREPAEEPSIDVEHLEAAVASLGRRVAMIVWGYYRDGLTMKEIGERLGISECRVSQIHSEAIARLRTHTRAAFAIEE